MPNTEMRLDWAVRQRERFEVRQAQAAVDYWDHQVASEGAVFEEKLAAAQGRLHDLLQEVPCPSCHGSTWAHHAHDACERCDGRGWVTPAPAVFDAPRPEGPVDVALADAVRAVLCPGERWGYGAAANMLNDAKRQRLTDALAAWEMAAAMKRKAPAD